MKHDETDLLRRLAEVDRPLPFDAAAFAARVIVQRSRRRYRRRVAVACGVVALTLVSLASSLFLHGRPEAYVKETLPESGDSSIVPDPPEERRGVMLHWLAESNKREQQINRLLHRIASAKATMTAIRKEQDRQMLALYRAQFSGDIAVPDPVQLYGGVVGYPPTDPSTP
jgi:hypothetical protein